MVFVGVMNEADICNVDVNRKMLKFVNKTHSKYVKQLENRKSITVQVRKKELKKEKSQIS